MDELWQRYRTFWTPVLIGVGVFLVGIIAVHIITKDPEAQKRGLIADQSSLRGMKRPERGVAEQLRKLTGDLDAQATSWATRLDTSRSAGEQLLEQGVDRALRAAILRGASDAEARDTARLAARFDDDEVAAARAARKFATLKPQSIEQLRSGDPNVAFGGLKSEVWTALRVRANRADMEIADALGFDAIASVNRATLPGCVLSLALVADLADLAIRGGVSAFDMIKVGPNITPGQPTDFVTEWPVTIAMEGPYGAIARLVDRVTDPQHAEALLGATLKQPGGRTGRTPDGVVRFEATLAAAVVRPAVDLGLDRSEQ
ncbi:MAG: hypothetical protein H6826_08290 [Planctomycetes bacterium]|nr:hypothetical protein [Planctomycetota bacterium]MCB9825692.1 hypothetical protein [Planctomycetota bacterium]MCB9901330.1 hypothetical protein [Planctomycetota bacterium]